MKEPKAVKHVHQFIVPVEWEYTMDLTGRYYSGMIAKKLRCECGKEVDR